MKSLKWMLSAYVLVTMNVGLSSFAKEAVLRVRGCGTGCRIETVQLTSPSWMRDGWAKVLERESMYIIGINGRDEKYYRGQALPAVGQYWIFAKCNDKWFGIGYKSDGSDAKTESIYDESGKPKSYTAGENVYNRHQKLCSALRK
jgi:hypothetical protein